MTPKYNIAGHIAYKIFSKGHSVTPLPGRLSLFYIRKVDNNVLGKNRPSLVQPIISSNCQTV